MLIWSQCSERNSLSDPYINSVIMAEDTILQVLCGNHGAMDYERLLDISFGLTEISPQNSLDKILRESGAFTVIQRDGSKEVFAQANVKLCRRRECDEQSCGDLHMCKYELMTGRCNRCVETGASCHST